MKKQKSNYTDDGVYYSNSTVDSNEQPFLPKMEEELEKTDEPSRLRKFKVEMTLSLAPLGEKAVKIPITVGEYPSNRVLEILTASLSARRVKQVIEAVLDDLPAEPVFNVPVSETLQKHEAKQDNEVIVVVEKKKRAKKDQLTIGNDGAGHFSDPESEDYFGGDEQLDQAEQADDEDQGIELDPTEHEGVY